jgi:hypothetical protein
MGASVSIDSEQQREYLRVGLSQAKRPLGLFLGAGAPLSVRPGGLPLIPDLLGLTAAITQTLAGGPHDAVWVRLLADCANGRTDPVNLELVLDYIRHLHAVPGSDDVRGYAKSELQEVERRVCSEVSRLADASLPSGVFTPYHQVAAWVQSTPRSFPVEIFTTNYDLLMEEALEYQAVPFFDGFVGSREPFFRLEALEEDALPRDWARLWKLHGSINWRMAATRVVRASPEGAGAGALIYPSHLKYDESRRLPYLAMLDRLRVFLRRPSALLVTCGFSFADQHLNEIIVQSLQANPTAACFSLQYPNLATVTSVSELARRTANLTVLAEDGGVVSGIAAAYEALPAGTTPLHLGDFAVFGGFLARLTGTAT